MSIRDRIRILLSDGEWRTGLEIALAIGKGSYTTGVAAKIRQLRDPRFGGHVIESEYDEKTSKASGMKVWRFRMVIPNNGNSLDCTSTRGMTVQANGWGQP